MEDVKEIGDVRFRHPCSVSVIGSSGTGKTSLILKIIDQIEHVMDFVPTKILYVYGCYQPAFEKFPQVTFYDGWDHPGLELSNLPTDSLLVCDDSVDLHPDKKFFVSFYTRESHHLRVSIITIFHNVFSKVLPDMRTLNMNTMYTILTASKRCFDQIDCLARQVFKSDSKAMIECYRRICEDQEWGYLVLDLHPKSNSMCKLQTNIFKEDGPRTIFVPKTQRRF